MNNERWGRTMETAITKGPADRLSSKVFAERVKWTVRLGEPTAHGGREKGSKRVKDDLCLSLAC